MKRAFILLTAAALLVASMAGTAQAACWGTINVNLKVIDNGVETTSTGFFSSEVPVWAFRSGDHPYNIAVNGSGVLTIGYFPESLWICWDKYPGWIQVKKYLDGERYLLASAVGTGWLNVDFLNWQSSEHPGYYYSDYCQVDEGSETLTIKYNKRARITQKHSFNDGTGMVTYPAGSWVNTGTSQTITAPARTGYTCTGWSGGTGSIPATGTSNTVTFSLRQDSSITWNYFKPPLTVSVIGVPPANQVGFAPPVGTTYHDYDSLLAFSAPDGLDCVGWVNGTGSIPATGDVLDSSVANFRQTSSLTWDCGAPSLEVRIDGLPEFLQDDISFSPEKGTKLYAYDSLLDVTSPYLVED